MIKVIIESIKIRFEEAYKRDEHTPARFFENLGWMYQDLVRIESDVIACFPPSYEIHSLYIREYHSALNATIKKLIMVFRNRP